MSRRNPTIPEILVQAPWWVSAFLAVFAFIALRWILPGALAGNSIAGPIAAGASQHAWMPAALLAVLAVVSAILAHNKRKLLDEQTSLESLHELSWQGFEWMVGEAYRRQNYSVEESIAGGADGGIDLIVRKNGETWLVQCKQWRVNSVGVSVIREMFGLVAHHGATGAIVITSGRFTHDALRFAEGKRIELIDGPQLLELVEAVQTSKPANPISPTTAVRPPPPITSPTTPLCPQCNGPMVQRVARRGTNAGNSFWGCVRYPSCRGIRDV